MSYRRQRMIERGVGSAVLLAVALSLTSARADMTHLITEAVALTIEGSCARTVTILPDGILTRQIVLDAAADHPEETAQLTFADAPATKLRPRGGACWHPEDGASWSPTLDLTIRVPFDFPLTLQEQGAAGFNIGGTGGALTIEASGAMTLAARKLSALTLTSSGSGAFSVARLDGPARLALSGSGTVRVGSGMVDPLMLDSSGSASVLIEGTVAGGSAHVSGSGSVEIAHLTGTLERQVTGSGTIHAGPP